MTDLATTTPGPCPLLLDGRVTVKLCGISRSHFLAMRAAGLPAPDKFVGNFVKSITVENGSVNVVLGSRVNKHIEGKVLSIRPAIVKGTSVVPIAWVCGSASVPEGMTASAENKSTLTMRHMPVPCRY